MITTSSSPRPCPCVTGPRGTAAGTPLHCPFDATAELLPSIPVPPALTLAAGGSRHRPHRLAAPPAVALGSDDPADVLAMLRYAGVRYASPESPAAAAGHRVFAAGRALGRDGPYDAVTVDWDHTLSNYQVFEGVPRLLRLLGPTPPGAAFRAAPFVAIETARPFMIELVFGMMAGFALRQGLARLSDWSRYRPQVGIATHTPPNRLAVLAAHFFPILPLMEGLLPDAPRIGERFASSNLRSVVHLHHFLDYATALMRRFGSHGFAELAPAQRDEVMRYLEDGSAHRRKPLGAWAARGWPATRLLHIDDSTAVVADLARQAALAGHAGLRAVHVPHPHSRGGTDIRRWHMFFLPGLWRRRQDALRGVAASLVRKEWTRSAVPALLRGLAPAAAADAVVWPAAALPAGTVMTLHEIPTSVGEVWDSYVAPVNAVRLLIGEVRRRRGGLRAIRQAWRDAASPVSEPDVAYPPRRKERA